jgi:hypothetical protein
MATAPNPAIARGLTSTMNPGTGQIVLGVYRPRSGLVTELSDLLLSHVPTLRDEGLAAGRPWLLLRATDGCHIEMFSWLPGARADQAHQNPRVADLWRSIARTAEHVPLPGLPSRLSSRFEAIAWEP